MKTLADVISRWPKMSVRNYVAGLSRKQLLDILQIVLIGVPVLIVVALVLGRRTLGAIGLPGPIGSFAIWFFVGFIAALAIVERARQLAAPAFLAIQPIPEAAVTAARRILAVPVLFLVFGFAASISLALWHFVGLSHSGQMFVLPIGMGLILGAIVCEIPFSALQRSHSNEEASLSPARARSLFSGFYAYHGPVVTWWRFHDRRAGSFLTLKLGIGTSSVVVLAVLATLQKEPWAWPALIWLVTGAILVEEVNLSGLASRIALVQPTSFWCALRNAAVWPFLAATGVGAALGVLGGILGTLTMAEVALNMGSFMGIGLFYICALSLARGNRQAALLIAFACLILIGSVAEYLREGAPLALLGVAVALLMKARRNYLWPSLRT
jgi:hypothetical protein